MKKTIWLVLLWSACNGELPECLDDSCHAPPDLGHAADLTRPPAYPPAECGDADRPFETMACSIKCGSEERTGTRTCVDSHWTPCSASCACIEGTTRPCYSGPASTRGVGACGDGVETCHDGVFGGACAGEVTPRTESCDGVDNDCDGSVDEGLGTTSCGSGACRRTVAACTNGKPTACAPGQPKSETCNGADDDCDGSVDENLPVVYTFRNQCKYSYVYMTFGNSYGTTCNTCSAYCNEVAVAPGASITYTVTSGQCFYSSAYAYVPTPSGSYVACLSVGTVTGTDGQIHQHCANSCSPKTEPMAVFSGPC